MSAVSKSVVASLGTLIYRPPANELDSCFMLVNKEISLSCINDDPFFRTGSGSKQERSGIQLMSNLSIRFIAELTFLCARFIYARLFSLIYSLYITRLFWWTYVVSLE